MIYNSEDRDEFELGPNDVFGLIKFSVAALIILVFGLTFLIHFIVNHWR